MKAVSFQKHGGTDVLNYTEDFAKPEINSDEALIKIKSTSVNSIDSVMRNGYQGLNIPLPHIPGGDIAGEIVEISNNSEFNIGDRVVCYPVIYPNNLDPKYKGMEFLNEGWQFFGMHRHGSYAEYISAPIETLVKIPENVSYDEAASLPIAGLTAYHALIGVGNLQKGDTLLIWGGSGGLSSIAIQIAKSIGATVITSTRDESKKQKLIDLGADYVFNTNQENVVEEIRKEFPNGIDIVLDYVGPTTFDKSFSLVRKNGKILFCGMITGREIILNIQQTYFRHINIHGLYLGSKQEFIELLNMVDRAEVKPIIENKFQLSEAKQAQDLFESGNYIGKIIINP